MGPTISNVNSPTPKSIQHTVFRSKEQCFQTTLLSEEEDNYQKSLLQEADSRNRALLILNQQNAKFRVPAKKNREIRKMRTPRSKVRRVICAQQQRSFSLYIHALPPFDSEVWSIAGVWERRVSAGCGLTWQHQRTPPLTHTREALRPPERKPGGGRGRWGIEIYNKKWNDGWIC